MFVNAKSEKYPDATRIMLEEGNFHFTAGLRMCISLLDSSNNVIVKRLLIINGEDFKKMLEKTRGMDLLKGKIMNLMDLTECGDIPLE